MASHARRALSGRDVGGPGASGHVFGPAVLIGVILTVTSSWNLALLLRCCVLHSTSLRLVGGRERVRMDVSKVGATTTSGICSAGTS